MVIKCIKIIMCLIIKYFIRFKCYAIVSKRIHYTVIESGFVLSRYFRVDPERLILEFNLQYTLHDLELFKLNFVLIINEKIIKIN